MINIHINIKKDYKNLDYKYILTLGGMNWTAFHNDAGFYNFINILGGSFKISNIYLDKYGEGVVCGYIEKDVKELSYFSDDGFIDCKNYKIEHKKTQIPKEAKKTILLSNGSYNDGFYYEKDNVIYLYRLNPNDKNYNHNTVEDYRSFAKFWG